MLGYVPFFLHTPWAAGLVVALGLFAALVALVRRPAVPQFAYACAVAALALMALAAGGLTWERAIQQQVALMVDLSPSTRTADYRDRTTLERRIHELLGAAPYRIEYFADHAAAVDPTVPRLPDIAADRTAFDPPAAAAVLLFSDCRFPLPRQSPPTYVVIDPALDDVEDAAVTNLEIIGKDAAATVRNTGGSRRLIFTGAARAPATTAPSGTIVVRHHLADEHGRMSAELSPGDAWPENDALVAAVAAPEQLERWWVGTARPDGWRGFTAAQLPADPAAYLAASVIVLQNVSAADLSDTQQQRLRQYVRDLGGALLILGGDHAFAAGGYTGTALDALSPLAGNPPDPTTHWMLLADSSGSMADSLAGASKWNFVTTAVAQLLPHLPPDDLVSVGSFAERLDWWVQGRAVRDVESMTLPPASAFPHGPTNLQPALEAIARAADGKMPTQLLVLSDLDTRITAPEALAALLKSKHVRLHLLAIGDGTALPVLREVSAATGGTVIRQLDPRRWSEAARQLARAAAPNLLETDPVVVAFSGAAPVTATPWNRTWVKPAAARQAQTRRGTDVLPMAANWNAGEGRVTAIAFDPPVTVAQGLARGMDQPPHDPRFRVTWQTEPMLHVSIDAASGGRYLNGHALTLEVEHGKPQAIAQSGPGFYELTTAAPRSPGVATVRADGHAVSRIILPGRYAPEFDMVGNDRAAMEQLAGRSGGQVVPPNQASPLDIRFPRRAVPLGSVLAAAAAILLAAGLLWWHGR